MTYEPWAFEPTRELYNLFQQKFGKVWENKLPIEDFDGHLYITKESVISIFGFADYSEDQTLYDSIGYPALTLSSFCEFVDENFSRLIQLDYYINTYYIKGLFDSYNQKYGYTNIHIHLKHFAVDHWDEPQKIINEVKKYL
jgi:hypothetical protein